MARISKELKENRTKLFNKYSDILRLLVFAKGALYSIQLEMLLGINKNTLRYQLNKLCDVGLVELNTVSYYKTSRTVVRLTSACWRLFNINNCLCSLSLDRLTECTLNACINHTIYSKYSKQHENKEFEYDAFNCTNKFYDALEYHSTVRIFEQQVCDKHKLVDLDNFRKRYSRNVIVINYKLDSNDGYVHIIFHKNNPQAHDLAEFCDHLLGIIEKSYFIKNENFRYERFKFKIKLYVVSTSKISYADFNAVMNKLQRKYAYFNHRNNIKMYNARRVHFNKIKFQLLDTSTLKFKEY